MLKEYRHNTVTIRVHGSACHATVKEATLRFLKKIEMNKAKRKEQIQNGNTNTSRTI